MNTPSPEVTVMPDIADMIVTDWKQKDRLAPMVVRWDGQISDAEGMVWEAEYPKHRSNEKTNAAIRSPNLLTPESVIRDLCHASRQQIAPLLGLPRRQLHDMSPLPYELPDGNPKNMHVWQDGNLIPVQQSRAARAMITPGVESHEDVAIAEAFGTTPSYIYQTMKQQLYTREPNALKALNGTIAELPVRFQKKAQEVRDDVLHRQQYDARDSLADLFGVHTFHLRDTIRGFMASGLDGHRKVSEVLERVPAHLRQEAEALIGQCVVPSSGS